MIEWLDGDAIFGQTGVIVPAYFSATTDDETVRRLLWMTLADLPRVVDPDQVWLVIDGDERTARVAAELLATRPYCCQLLPLSENRGKLGAMRAGVQTLLEARPRVRYVTFLDGDADHMATVIPRLVRTAAHIASARDTDRVMVIGRRSSRSRPMGWLRGQLEELLDQLTMDALSFSLAREGKVLDLSCCASNGVCDISSGFKVLTRPLAADRVATEPAFLGSLTRFDYDHYGPETTLVTEAVVAGATVIEMLRPTWDGQPTTAFGEFRVVAMYGGLLSWVWQRLDIAVGQAAAMWDNRAAGYELKTTREGAQALDDVRRFALQQLLDWHGDQAAIPAPQALPLFF